MSTNTMPEYMPARMLNEFVYCPRLFYYEWVEGVFVDNSDTLEGSRKHKRVEKPTGDKLPEADKLDDEKIHSRSVTLSSDELQLIAKMDLIEAEDGVVTPVDYKRGKPFKAKDGSPTIWDTDRIQLGVQSLVLRDNGYTCDEGVIFYAATKQRVRISIDEELVAETVLALERARQTAEGEIPPPLEDSPKCPRCSLVGVCLPDETNAAKASDSKVTQRFLFDIESPPSARDNVSRGNGDVRRLVPARDDLRPAYLNTQGLRVGKSGGVLKVKEKDRVIQEIRLGEICQLNVMGNVQLSTQAIQAMCEEEIPIAYFSQGGWFYGVTHGLGIKNIFLRREQFRWADIPSFCLRFAKALVGGKIRNQRTMLQRNHIEPPRRALDLLKCYIEDTSQANSLESLLGIEGNAARLYFENLAGMIKVGEEAETNGFTFDFTNRNRRPPRDPVNALLSLAYSMLAKDLTIICHTVGFDPYLGFYHQPRFGRAALPLDLMEPFRPLIADSAVLSAINTKMVAPKDFVQAGLSVALKPQGRKAFFRAYEQRMDTLVTHPLFGYRVSYRRLLEIQTRLLARVLTGEMHDYPVFTTR